MFNAAETPFADQLRIDLLDVEAQLRPLIRRLHYDPAAQWPDRKNPLKTRFGTAITISAHEARTLLRAAMPFPMTTRARHKKHAALVATLATFAGELHGLTLPQAGESAIAAGLDLIQALDNWIGAMRWTAATAAAGVKWPMPKQPENVAVTPLLQHRTSPDDPLLFSEAAKPTKKRRQKNRHDPPLGQPQRSLLLPIDSRPKTQMAAVHNQADAPTPNQAHDLVRTKLQA